MTLVRAAMPLFLVTSMFVWMQSPQPAVRRISHKVSCTSCRVEFTRIAVLGKDSDPALISPFASFDRDSRGRYYSFSDYSEVIVFDSRGNFLRTIGRAGNGPGEFGISRAALSSLSGMPPLIKKVRVGRGDSILVYHDGRISVFTPDYVHARTTQLVQIPNGGGAIYPLGDGSWLLGGDLRTRDTLRQRIHQIGSDGKLRRSLGATQKVDSGRPVGFISSFFIMSPDERTFWTTDERYTLESWRLSDGAYQGKIQVQGVPWMVEPNYVNEPTRSGTVFRRSVGGGYANVGGVDSLGRLWMTGRTTEGNPKTVEAAAKAKKTFRVEIFDPRSGTIVSSQITPDYMTLSPRADFALSYAENANGIPIVTVYSYRFAER